MSGRAALGPFGKAMFVALGIFSAVACAAPTEDPAEGLDEATGAVEPSRYVAEVKKDLREGCSSQQLTPSEATYCQQCAAQSDPSIHKSCSCSIKCTSTGVIKMCGCTTFSAGPTH